MPEKTLGERVAALEAQMLGKTFEKHFREQAEIIDRLFAYRLEEVDDKWDAKLETTFETKLEPIKRDLAVIKDAVKVILTRLT